MPRIQISRRGGRHRVLPKSTRTSPTHGNRRHHLGLGPLALVALLPFGPIDIVAISTLPVSHCVRVVRRLWWHLWRRRRRSLYRGHGRARRLAVRAAAAVVPRLIRIVYPIAVLRAVDDAHVVVSDSRRVLAVLVVARTAAVLHRCSYRDSAGALLVWGSTGRVSARRRLRGVDVRSDGGGMWRAGASPPYDSRGWGRAQPSWASGM